MQAADRPIICLRQEAGGEGKGANSAPRTTSPTSLQTGLQFLTKDFLRFWMVDIYWEGRSQKSAAQKRHKVNRPARRETEAGTTEGIRRTAPGESALIKLLVA